MATVKLDITQGASFERAADGLRCVRVAVVTGLSGGAQDRLYAASTASGLPALGSAHPSVPAMRLTSIEAQPQGDSAALVRLVYRTPESIPGADPADPTLPRYEVGSSVVTTRTLTDAAGDPLEVSYDGAERLEDEPRTQRVNADVMRPQTTLRVVRVESSSPAAAARDKVGKVNGSTWQSGAAKTWLCTGIHGKSVDAGETWLVTYDFQFNPATWRRTVGFTSPRTGRVPSDASESGPELGIKTFDLYETADFSALGL